MEAKNEVVPLLPGSLANKETEKHGLLYTPKCLPEAIGIGDTNGCMIVILPKGTLIPCKKLIKCGAGGLISIVIAVYIGCGKFVKNNICVGKVVITLPIGLIHFHVGISINCDLEIFVETEINGVVGSHSIGCLDLGILDVDAKSNADKSKNQ